MTSPADVHAAKLAAIEAADDAEESLRMRLARAFAAQFDGLTPPIDDDDWEYLFREDERNDWLRLADVALDVVSTPVEGAPAGGTA